MDESAKHDAWGGGSDYEAYIGRWSRLVARRFISWLGLGRGLSWLDVGCGTGALSRTILDAASPSAVCGVDPSVGFIEFARDQVTDERARFDVGDAQALAYADGKFDAVVSGLVLNFVPEPARAVSEMVRVAVPGAIVAVYVWDYSGEMQMLRHFWDAAAELDPSAADLDEGSRFPVCRPEALRELFAEAGLREVDTQAIDVETLFTGFDELWPPFLGGQGSAPGYVASLDEHRRAALREQLRANLPAAPDGSINLIARAWTVRGTVSQG